MCTAPFPFQTSRAGKFLASWIFVIFLTASCPFLPCAQAQQNSPIDLLAKRLADRLASNLSIGFPRPPRTLIVSIVDVSQLHCTSRFGQIVPEKLRVFLQERGWKIVEARRGLTVKLQEGVGQFNLSDNLTDLAKEVNCHAILAGTYLFHMGKIIVNMRLIHLPDNEIISTASAEMEANPWISTLLRPVGIGCKAPKSFLKITPWRSNKSQTEGTRYSTKEEPIDDHLY